MYHNQIEITLLVKGRPITEYHHHGQVFVEGRAGSEYEIEIQNKTHERLEAVLSVDGLSVIDGKPAGTQSSGYLLEPNGNVRVPGWMLDNQSVAKFAFAGKQQSYATQMTGDPSNNGVIGVMVFKEKVPVVALAAASYSGLRGTPRGIECSAGMSAQSNTYLNNFVSTDSMIGAVYQNSLGTAFGESIDFQTAAVKFEREDLLCMMVIYYDEANGLKARGIRLERPSKKKKYQQQPEAFPATQTGCAPPPNWNR